MNYYKMGIGDWGLGIGDWGLGIGPNPQSPIPIGPNPQSPIPNPQKYFYKYINFSLNLNNNNKKIEFKLFIYKSFK